MVALPTPARAATASTQTPSNPCSANTSSVASMMACSACSLRGRPGGGSGAAGPARSVPGAGPAITGCMAAHTSRSAVLEHVLLPLWPARPRRRDPRARAAISAAGRGLPGIQRSTTNPPASASSAATSVVMCMACTNASFAGASSDRPAGAELLGDRLGGGDRRGRRAPRRGGQVGQRRAERAPVELGQDRAEDGDAERDRDLAGGVGQRGARAGPLARQHVHDGGGGGRHDDADRRALDARTAPPSTQIGESRCRAWRSPRWRRP